METKTEELFPALTTIGIDIGKDIFDIVGFDTDGKIALRKIKRLALAELPTPDECSGRRSAHVDGGGGGDRHGRGLRPRPRLWGLARPGTSAAQYRWQADPRAHLEAREQVSSDVVHSGGESASWLENAAPRLHRNKLANALANRWRGSHGACCATAGPSTSTDRRSRPSEPIRIDKFAIEELHGTDR